MVVPREARDELERVAPVGKGHGDAEAPVEEPRHVRDRATSTAPADSRSCVAPCAFPRSANTGARRTKLTRRRSSGGRTLECQSPRRGFSSHAAPPSAFDSVLLSDMHAAFTAAR